MRVNFKNIHIEGFMSLGVVDLDLNNKGLVLVEGRNSSGVGLSSNGSGKSCLFEAIYWVLTGKTIRGAKEVVNRYFKGHTVVKLVMEVNSTEYVLHRYREHPDHKNNLLVYKDGIDISGSGVRKSEEILASELPFLTDDLIGSIIILGQGLPSRFTGYDPAGRKELLEILSGNVGIIEGMKNKLTAYKNDVSKKVADKTAEVNRLESAIEIRKRDIEEIKLKQGEKVEDTESLKKELELAEQEKETNLANLQKLENSLDTLKSALATQQVEKSKIEYEIGSIEKDIVAHQSKLNSLKSDICPTCNQIVGDENLLERLRKEAMEAVTQQENLKVEHQKNLKQIDELLSLYEEKISTKLSQVTTQKKWSDELECGIIEIRTKLGSSIDYTEKLQTYIKEVSDNDVLLFKVITELTQLIKDEKVTSYILREVGRDFRGYLLKGIIDYLNTLLAEFAEVLFGKKDLKLILDDNKIYIEYEGRSYESLSGGEKHRADLAMQFSLRDMIVRDLGYSFNILVLDEIFDNLDETGVENLIRFLVDNLSEIESVFVVSHHPALPVPFENKIVAVKGKNLVTELEVGV